jgi:hypothetical protein
LSLSRLARLGFYSFHPHRLQKRACGGNAARQRLQTPFSDRRDLTVDMINSITTTTTKSVRSGNCWNRPMAGTIRDVALEFAL